MGRAFIARGISTSPHCCANLSLTFACPRSVFYNATNVKQVDVPGSSSAFGILPEHVPTISTLRPGVVAVYEDDGSVKKFFGEFDFLSIENLIEIAQSVFFLIF